MSFPFYSIFLLIHFMSKEGSFPVLNFQAEKCISKISCPIDFHLMSSTTCLKVKNTSLKRGREGCPASSYIVEEQWHTRPDINNVLSIQYATQGIVVKYVRDEFLSLKSRVRLEYFSNYTRTYALGEARE